MSDGGFDVDKHIKNKKKKENLFGTIKDHKTGQYVSFPYIDKEGLESSIESEIIDDFSWEEPLPEQEKSPTNEKDRVVEMDYSNQYLNSISICEWEIKMAYGMNWNLLEYIESWVNDNVELKEPGKVYLDKTSKKGEMPPKFKLIISGSGNDHRCIWCRSFLTSLSTIAEKDSFDLIKNGACRFESSR